MSRTYLINLVPLPDKPGGPSGAQRVRSALKELRRRFGIRAEWIAAPLASDMAAMGPLAAPQPTLASVHLPTQQRGGKRKQRASCGCDNTTGNPAVLVDLMGPNQPVARVASTRTNQPQRVALGVTSK